MILSDVSGVQFIMGVWCVFCRVYSPSCIEQWERDGQWGLCQSTLTGRLSGHSDCYTTTLNFINISVDLHTCCFLTDSFSVVPKKYPDKPAPMWVQVGSSLWMHQLGPGWPGWPRWITVDEDGVNYRIMSQELTSTMDSNGNSLTLEWKDFFGEWTE